MPRSSDDVDSPCRHPGIKLRDYRARQAELEASRDAVATVAPAHLDAQATSGTQWRGRERSWG